MTDISQMKQAFLDLASPRDVIALVKSDYGWQIVQWTADSIFPTSDYDTPHEAAARACQLLGLTEPVMPQTWPEIAQVGGGKAVPPRHPYPGE